MAVFGVQWRGDATSSAATRRAGRRKAFLIVLVSVPSSAASGCTAALVRWWLERALTLSFQSTRRHRWTRAQSKGTARKRRWSLEYKAARMALVVGVWPRWQHQERLPARRAVLELDGAVGPVRGARAVTWKRLGSARGWRRGARAATLTSACPVHASV